MIETRTGGTCGLTTNRAKAGSGIGTIGGYAARFNSETVIGDLFREVIEPHAFASAIPKSDVRALFNHDSNQLPLGRTSAGTLTVAEDARGLRYSVVLPDSPAARALIESVTRRDVRESSFAFTVAKDLWETTERSALPLRRIVEVATLFDVSPVVYPAYAATTVEIEGGARKEHSHMGRECAAVVGSVGDTLRVRKVLEARASARVCARCQARLGSESCVIGTARRFDVVCPMCAEYERLRSLRAAMTSTKDDLARRRAELARRERALRA